MKTRMLKYFTILMGAAAVTSCNSWLDMDPTDKISESLVWENEEYAELYINSMYPYISIYGSFNTEGSTATGVGLTEGCTETLKYTSYTKGTNVGHANWAVFAEGGLDVVDAEYYYGTWSEAYPRIRRVNELIYTMNKYATGYPEETRRGWLAQARFFRGYLYFELIKRHKDVILYDEDLLGITSNKALSSEAEGWNMVYEDLKYAAENLPKDAEVGRVTKGAAYALLSRAMLYAERWDDAKSAAEAVFALEKYSLVDGSTGAKYADAFVSASEGNTEAILEYNYLASGPSHTWDALFMPGGDQATKGGKAVPTQEMVESYERAGGGDVDWSEWHVEDDGITTTTPPPYAELEPRFQASILYNGAAWKGRTIEAYIDGQDGWSEFNTGTDPQGTTVTGYYLRKFVDESHTDYSMQSTQTWVAIRLAEVYLNYAEACYMSENRDLTNANNALKAVRNRVGLPYNDKSGEELMEAIREERKIELYCEGHRFWDMRRWGLSDTAYSGIRVHGLRIENMGSLGFNYKYVDCDGQDRLFETKLYRIPIPSTEISANPSVSQYPEWL